MSSRSTRPASRMQWRRLALPSPLGRWNNFGSSRRSRSSASTATGRGRRPRRGLLTACCLCCARAIHFASPSCLKVRTRTILCKALALQPSQPISRTPYRSSIWSGGERYGQAPSIRRSGGPPSKRGLRRCSTRLRICACVNTTVATSRTGCSSCGGRKRAPARTASQQSRMGRDLRAGRRCRPRRPMDLERSLRSRL